MLTLYVPTTPNPTSGFYLLVPINEVTPLNMTMEEAFKLIIYMALPELIVLLGFVVAFMMVGKM